MVKVQPTPEHDYYLDGYLQANLDVSIREVRKKDYDRFILLTGREGSGKTTLSLQIALYCDPTFNIDRVCFTPEDFLDAVENAEKYQAIVFDETMWGLGVRNVMSKMNKILIKVMSEMRSKNLFVFMNIPNFFMMDWYVALHRSTGLLYIYRRGFFGSYDYPTKKKLYMQGKKYHSYNVSPNFRGRSVKYFPIDKKAYEKKKQTAIDGWIKRNSKSDNWKAQRDLLINHCLEEKFMNQTELANMLNVTKDLISKIHCKSAEKPKDI